MNKLEYTTQHAQACLESREMQNLEQAIQKKRDSAALLRKVLFYRANLSTCIAAKDIYSGFFYGLGMARLSRRPNYKP